MTLIAEKAYTTWDFLNDPNLAGFELIDGQLVERPTSKRSSRIGGEIFRLLSNEAARTREAAVYPCDLGYDCFPDSTLNLRFPDVSLVRSSRDADAGEDSGFMSIPADLVVEVLSPNDVIRKVNAKVKDYLTAGFTLVWVVDPDWKHVHVYRGDGTVQLLTEHDEITGETALPGFRCKVGEFFAV